MPFNANGSNREPIAGLTPNDQRDLIQANVLLVDQRRQRPHWFDGRFLAARDLANEQNYFLIRQSDLGRAGGSGVVEGLDVSAVTAVATNTGRLRIEAGHGVTDTGELVVLPEAIEFDTANVPELQRLDAAFGLQAIPNEPGRTRTGLYAVVLRAVEWTANPIAAYPTSLTGQRTVEDGDIIEGVAVSLVPLPDTGEGDWNRRRARIAREIFVEGRDQGVASGTLPLALVALRGNLVEWVDRYLVRRDAGAERPAGNDFGFGQRALREAHLVQYDRHLVESVEDSAGQPFQATQWFDALPPVGRLPSNTLSASNLSQRYFPPGIAVDLSFIPEDELAVLIEESLSLPPLDLVLTADALTGVAVLVVVPLTRADFNLRRSTFAGASHRLTTPVIVPRAKTTPLELLLSRSTLFNAGINGDGAPSSDDGTETLWRSTLQGAQAQPYFWYVRRRHLPLFVNQPGTRVDAFNNSVDDPEGLNDLGRRDPEIAEGLRRLRSMEQPVIQALFRRLARRAVVENPAFLKSLLRRALHAADRERSPSGAVAVLAPLADPDFGVGLMRLSAIDPKLHASLKVESIADSGLLPEIDWLARGTGTEKLAKLAQDLRPAAKHAEVLPKKVRQLRTAMLRKAGRA